MPITEIGIEVQMMMVARQSRRKAKMTRTTSRLPSSACSRTLPIDRSMKIDWSSSTVRATPGTSRLMRAISARTPSAICTVLVPDCLVTRMRMPGVPLMRVNWRRSSVVSRTSAMSRM